jgi:predicted HNH restriction endonuclease
MPLATYAKNQRERVLSGDSRDLRSRQLRDLAHHKGDDRMIKKKPSRKKPVTPRSQIRSALRRLFLRSREHAEALKRDNRTCQVCHVKQTKPGKDKSKWKLVYVHHLDGIENWNLLFETIYQYLLCHPDNLTVLCNDCHDKIHRDESKIMENQEDIK